MYNIKSSESNIKLTMKSKNTNTSIKHNYQNYLLHHFVLFPLQFYCVYHLFFALISLTILRRYSYVLKVLVKVEKLFIFHSEAYYLCLAGSGEAAAFLGLVLCIFIPS